MTFDFITITPDSGTGNATLNISATENTGRNSRSKTISAKETSSSTVSSNTLKITQSGAAEFIDITSTGSISKNGGDVSVTFRSNTKSFIAKVDAPTGYSSQTPTIKSISINGSPVTITGTNNITVTPAGDPGASAEYSVSMSVTVPANAATTSVQYLVTLTSAVTASVKDTGNIIQAGADKYLKFVNAQGTEISSITINANGAANTGARISSNIGWTLTNS